MSALIIVVNFSDSNKIYANPALPIFSLSSTSVVSYGFVEESPLDSHTSLL